MLLEILEHRRHRRFLDAYVDGELSDRRRASTRRHLTTCWACSGEVTHLRFIKASMGHLRDRRPTHLASARLSRFAHGLARPS